MGSVSSLINYTGRSFLRDKGVILTILVLPVLLLTVAKESAPIESIPLKLDDTVVVTETETLILVLYSMTAVVLVSVITSFFLAFNQKKVIPRLKIVGYKEREIATSFVVMTSFVNLTAVVIVWWYTTANVDVTEKLGFFVGLLAISVIMSILGLIVAEVISSKTLSLYVLLSISIIDASFIENPAFSRRYNDDWTQLMPSNLPLKVLLRSVYDTGTVWTEGVALVALYIAALFLIYVIVRSLWKRS